VPRNAKTNSNVDIHEVDFETAGAILFVNAKYSRLTQLNPEL